MLVHGGGFHPGRLWAIVLALVLTFAATPLRAAGLDEALSHFTSDDFSETADGIAAVAESGDPRAALRLFLG